MTATCANIILRNRSAYGQAKRCIIGKSQSKRKSAGFCFNRRFIQRGHCQYPANINADNTTIGNVSATIKDNTAAIDNVSEHTVVDWIDRLRSGSGKSQWYTTRTSAGACSSKSNGKRIDFIVCWRSRRWWNKQRSACLYFWTINECMHIIYDGIVGNTGANCQSARCPLIGCKRNCNSYPTRICSDGCIVNRTNGNGSRSFHFAGTFNTSFYLRLNIIQRTGASACKCSDKTWLTSAASNCGRTTHSQGFDVYGRCCRYVNSASGFYDSSRFNRSQHNITGIFTDRIIRCRRAHSSSDTGAAIAFCAQGQPNSKTARVRTNAGTIWSDDGYIAISGFNSIASFSGNICLDLIIDIVGCTWTSARQRASKWSKFGTTTAHTDSYTKCQSVDTVVLCWIRKLFGSCSYSDIIICSSIGVCNERKYIVADSIIGNRNTYRHA